MAVFTRASVLSDFSAFANSQGLQPQALLVQAGLPRDVEAQGDDLIAFGKLLALLDHCEQQSGNRLFALQFGLSQSVTVFGPLFYLVRNAKDVRAALIELTRYFHIHSGAAALTLEEQGKHAMLTYSITDSGVFGARHAVERAVGVGAQLLRTLLGQRWRPEALLFQHAPSVDPAQYRRLLGILPRFNAPCNGWVFDAALLDTPLAAADPALHRLIQNHLNTLEQMSAQQLPTLVQQLIRSFMPDARATLEQVAGYMMLSTRKLQRLLVDEGTTFQELLTATRQSIARHYLQDSTISIAQMADLLGYSSQSAFSHAFHNWYGQSPREWRMQLADK
jgi:AraC-like DNA-binding protein